VHWVCGSRASRVSVSEGTSGSDAAPSGMGADERRYFRTDLLTPAASREDAVVAAVGGGVDFPHGRRQVGAQLVGGVRLTLAGDVVQFAFDGQQGGLADRRGVDLLAIDRPRAARQPEFLEDDEIG